MVSVPKRALDRISAGIKRFQPILAAAKARDVNEADTVVIVTDLLSEVFGYEKYVEITSEYQIRGTFCDLAIKLDDRLAFLMEVKAIGLDLKDQHVKQAVDYAANQGVEWVALTNGASWRVFRVSFTKPIDHELVVDFDLLTLSHRNADHVDLVALLSKEGWQKARLGDYYSQRQALNRFTLGALVLSDAVVEVLRREIRRMVPEIKIDTEQIKAVIEADVLKREILEGEKAEAARRQVARSASRALRASKAKNEPLSLTPDPQPGQPTKKLAEPDPSTPR